MTRKILISIIVIGWTVTSIQIIRTAFSSTLDHGILSISSIFSGLLFATLIKILFGYRKVAISWPITAFVFVFISTAIIALANYQLASSESQEREFIVKGKGERVLRYSSIDYVVLSDGVSSFTYTGVDEQKKLEEGNIVIVKVRRGFFGFDIVEL